MRSALAHQVTTMKFHALAVDYDGTLATNGFVDDATVETLIRLRHSGRRLILVTGRLLAPLLDAFPQVGLCHRVVAENGALLYDPDTRCEQLLAEPPPRQFVERLAERGVPASEVGRVIIATSVPYETQAFEVIRDMSLELQIIFNKGAVMILPSGINKASGLRRALYDLGLSPRNTVGIGDAENDHAFLKLCEVSAAVDNALESLKEGVDLVTRGAESAGVVELVERLIANDLEEMHALPKRGVLLGREVGGDEVWVPAGQSRVLVTGDSAGGKSKLVVSALEHLIEAGYQACVVDPEGDFQASAGPIVIGTLERAPTAEEVMQVIAQPDKSCVVSLFGAAREDQPPLFSKLFRALQDHRLQTGRPHWIIIDEAHYPVPAAWSPIEELHLEDSGGMIYITAFPDQMPKAVLRTIDLLIAISDAPSKLIASFCQAVGVEAPAIQPPPDHKPHRALAWWRSKRPPFWIQRIRPRGEHQRHQHQYFDGDMEPADRFYFRGPTGELNLAAQNLRTFMQMAEGVDDATWSYHLEQGDYARWFRDAIQDEELAVLADQLQRDDDASPQESRKRIADLIRKLYIKEL
jgi:HAD superfamily hydrolase (TIGR01484 family)